MRQCQKCGNMILDGQVACAKCGTPVQPEQQTNNQPTPAPTMPVMGQPASAPQSAPAPNMPVMGQPVQSTIDPLELAKEPAQSAEPVQPAQSTEPARPTANPLQSTTLTPSLPPVNPSTLDKPAMADTPAPEAPKPFESAPEFTSKKPKISKKTWIIVGVCLAVIVVIAIIMIVTMAGGKKGGSSSNNTPNTTIVSETKLTLGDYIISVPESYSYAIEADGSVELTADPEAWLANLYYIGDVGYDALVDNFSNVASSYVTTPGVSKVQDAGNATVGGREYLYVDVTSTEGNASGIYAYTKMGDNVLEIILQTSDGEFNHDLLEELNTIIDGAEKSTGIEDSFEKTATNKIRVDLKAAMTPAPVESPETPVEAPEAW